MNSPGFSHCLLLFVWAVFHIYTFYLWTKAIPLLCPWQLDAAVSRTSCVLASRPSDTLYSSSKHLSICAKIGQKWEIRDCKTTNSDEGISCFGVFLFYLPGTTLQALWVWKLVWLLFAIGTDFIRFLHLLKHLFLRPEGHGFTLGLQTSSAETNKRRN